MTLALQRLRTEQREIIDEQLTAETLGSHSDFKMILFLGQDPELNDPFRWKAIIAGPPDSPYKGGKFRLDISIPEDYPISAPQVRFGTQIYHPNILGTGEICLDILDDPQRWNSLLTLEKVCLSVLSILTEPQWNDPLDLQIGRILQWDPKKFYSTAQQWTKYLSDKKQTLATRNQVHNRVQNKKIKFLKIKNYQIKLWEIQQLLQKVELRNKREGGVADKFKRIEQNYTYQQNSAISKPVTLPNKPTSHSKTKEYRKNEEVHEKVRVDKKREKPDSRYVKEKEKDISKDKDKSRMLQDSRRPHLSRIASTKNSKKMYRQSDSGGDSLPNSRPNSIVKKVEREFRPKQKRNGNSQQNREHSQKILRENSENQDGSQINSQKLNKGSNQKKRISKDSREFDKFEKYTGNKNSNKQDSNLSGKKQLSNHQILSQVEQSSIHSQQLISPILEAVIPIPLTDQENISLDNLKESQKELTIKSQQEINQQIIKTQTKNNIMEIPDSSQCESNPKNELQRPEESNLDSFDWGHKYYKMKEDDGIYEMNYSEGTKKSSVKIMVSDFNRLEPSVYLNDTLILFFLKFMQNFVLTTEQVNKIHIFNSYFMELITKNVNGTGLMGAYGQANALPGQKLDINFNKMKRWTRSIDLFNEKIQHIFVPICENEHWSLAIICQPEKAGKLIEKHIEWCESGKPQENNKQENKSEQEQQDPGKGSGSGLEKENKQTQNGKSNATTGATSGSSLKLKIQNEAELECAKVLNLTEDLQIKPQGKEEDINDIFNPELENPEENIEFKQEKKKRELDKLSKNKVVPLILKQLDVQHKQDGPKLEPGLLSMRERLAAQDLLNFKNEKPIKISQIESIEIENPQENFMDEINHLGNQNHMRKFESSLLEVEPPVQQNTKKIKQYNIEAFINSQNADQEYEEDEENEPVTEQINYKTKRIQSKVKIPQASKRRNFIEKNLPDLLIPIPPKILKEFIKSNEDSQVGVSKNVGTKRIKPEQSLPIEYQEFVSGGISKKQKTSSNQESNQSKQKQVGNSKTKKNINMQIPEMLAQKYNNEYQEGKQISSEGQYTDIYNDYCQQEVASKAISKQVEPSKIESPSKQKRPSRKKIAQPKETQFQKNVIDQSPVKKVDIDPSKQLQKQAYDFPGTNSILSALKNQTFANPNNSKKNDPSKLDEVFNVIAEKPQKKSVLDRARDRIQKLVNNSFSNNQKVEFGTEKPISPEREQERKTEEQTQKIKQQKEQKKEKEIEEPKEPKEKKPKSPKIVKEPEPGKAEEKKGGGDLNSKINKTGNGIRLPGAPINFEPGPDSYDKDRDGGGGQNNDRKTSSVVEETGMTRPPQNAYRSNLYDQGGYNGGENFNDQFGSDAEDSFSEQDKVQKFDESDSQQDIQMQQNYQQPYIREAKQKASRYENNQLDEDEIMVDDDDIGIKMGKKSKRGPEHYMRQQMPEGIDSGSENSIGGDPREMDFKKYNRYNNDSDGPDSVEDDGPNQHVKRNPREIQYNQMGQIDRQPEINRNRFKNHNSSSGSEHEDEYDQEHDSDTYGSQGHPMNDQEDEFNNYLGIDKRKNKFKYDEMGDYGPAYFSKPVQKPKAPEMPPQAEMEKPFILYLDSLNRVNPTNMQCLRQYIEMEYIDKKLKNDLNKTKWLTDEHGWKGLKHDTMPHYQPSVPIQKNYTDCGLYLLENAESFIRDPDFIQKNLYQKEVKLFKTRLVEDKRDIMKRIITALAEHKPEKEDNQIFVGKNYAAWREQLYQKMTHYSTKIEETPQERTEDNPNLPHTQNKENSSSSDSESDKSSPKSENTPQENKMEDNKDMDEPSVNQKQPK